MNYFIPETKLRLIKLEREKYAYLQKILQLKTKNGKPLDINATRKLKNQTLFKIRNLWLDPLIQINKEVAELKEINETLLSTSFYANTWQVFILKILPHFLP